jgi:hypothetical protein
MFYCVLCSADVNLHRWRLGRHTCLPCGEIVAKRYKHTIVPMPKSNYIVVTDKSLLLNLNSSHKGGR